MPKESLSLCVADDNVSVRKALQRVLRSANYRSAAFASAEGYIDYALEAGKGCLILDILLPGMAGLELQGNFAHRGATYSSLS